MRVQKVPNFCPGSRFGTTTMCYLIHFLQRTGNPVFGQTASNNKRYPNVPQEKPLTAFSPIPSREVLKTGAGRFGKHDVTAVELGPGDFGLWRDDPGAIEEGRCEDMARGGRRKCCRAAGSSQGTEVGAAGVRSRTRWPLLLLAAVGIAGCFSSPGTRNGIHDFFSKPPPPHEAGAGADASSEKVAVVVDNVVNVNNHHSHLITLRENDFADPSPTETSSCCDCREGASVFKMGGLI